MKKLNFLILAGFFFLGCGGDNSKSKILSQILSDLKLEIVDGDQQSQLPNKSFVRSLQVRLFQSSTQVPISDIPIHFKLISGDATLNLTSQTVTNAAGLAQIIVTSGGTLGEVTIHAFPEGLSENEAQKVNAVFTLLVVNVRTPRLIPVDPKDLKQTAIVNKNFSKSLEVKAIDADGLPLQGEQVLFAPQPSSQVYVNFTDVVPLTSAEGKALATVQMGSYSGSIKIDAKLLINGQTTPEQMVTFQLTGVADAPFNIFPVSGHVESGLKVCVGENGVIPKPIRFRVVDAYDNPAPGVSVKFSTSSFFKTKLNQQPAGQDLFLTTNSSGEVNVNVQAGTIPLPTYALVIALTAQVVNASTTVQTLVNIDVTKNTYLKLISPQYNYGGTVVSPGTESHSFFASIYAYGKCWHLLPSVKHFMSIKSGICPAKVSTWPTETTLFPISTSGIRTDTLQPTNVFLFGNVMTSGVIVSQRDRFVASNNDSISIYMGETNCKP